MFKARYIIAGLLLIGALGYLGVAAVRSGWVYYVDVDRLLAEPELGRGVVRVHGRVASLVTDGDRAGFDLRGATGLLSVEYRGPLPDTFAEGREAVIEGRLDESGRLRAEVVMTKCSSKYSSAPSHDTAADATAEGRP